MKLSRKNVGRIATTFLATAMLASLTAVPAFATGEVPPVENQPEKTPGVTVPGESSNTVTGVTVTKTITTDGKTYAPNTEVKFSVWLGTGGAFNDGHGATVEALPGEAGGLTETSITFEPVEGVLSETYTATAQLAVDVSKFDEVGIYHYIVMEETGSYEGMDYSKDIYDLYLYVTNADGSDASDNDLVVSYVVCNSKDDAKTKTDLSFVNNYGDGDTPEEDGKIHDVIVTKQVAGDLGDKRNDEFEFKVKVDGDEGEKYLVEIDVTGDGKVDATQTVTSGVEATIGQKIKHNGTIHIWGLSESDTYTVTEVSANQNGYVTTDSDDSTEAGVVSGKAAQDGTPETITNTKNAVSPTGIAMDIAPYALLVVIAAAGCFVFLRKRDED